MRLLFTRTDTGWQSLGSRLIRAFEGGEASHCGALLSDGRVIDATWPRGVQAHALDDFLHGRVLVDDITVSLPDEAAAEAWLLSQIGQPYDLLDILSFLAWRNIGTVDRYACSGLMRRAATEGGLPPLERPERWGVRHLLIASRALAA